jgi:hypothetical protein
MCGDPFGDNLGDRLFQRAVRGQPVRIGSLRAAGDISAAVGKSGKALAERVIEKLKARIKGG